MKKAAYFILILLALLAFSGCGHCTIKPSPSAPATVNKVTVTYDSDYAHIRREYISSVKMRAILNYLRWIDPYGKPEDDPETAGGGLFCITLHLSDGGKTVYLQKADQYMQVSGGPWLTIDPNKALTLSKIVGEMESDM